MSTLSGIVHDGTLLATAAGALDAAGLAAAVVTSLFARCPHRRRDARQTLALLLPCRTPSEIPGCRPPMLQLNHDAVVRLLYGMEPEIDPPGGSEVDCGNLAVADGRGAGNRPALIRIVVVSREITVIVEGAVTAESSGDSSLTFGH